MALVGQHQQTSFVNPQNGQTPMDADVVRANDNAVTSKHNSHDSDATIHVQTGLLASRPAAGTANAMYLDENGRLYRDNGTSWAELPYARLDAAGVNTFTNNVAIGGTLDVTGNTTTNDLDAEDITAVSVTASGALAGASANIGGTATATLFSGSGASLTNLPAANLTGTLPAISGANLTSLNGSNIASGTVAAARLPTSYTALTITTLTSTAVVAPTLQGAASSPNNVLNLGDSATALLTLSASSSLFLGKGGVAGPHAITDGPTGFGTSCVHAGFAVIERASQFYYIPVFSAA